MSVRCSDDHDLNNEIDSGILTIYMYLITNWDPNTKLLVYSTNSKIEAVQPIGWRFGALSLNPASGNYCLNSYYLGNVPCYSHRINKS